MLVKEGRFVSKIFLGSSFNEIVALGKKIFKEVKVFKPKSSRKESKESFIICKTIKIETLILKEIIYKSLWIL